ncbi:MAG: cache domain-containing protein [Rhodocyclaceae bacterium]|nr:cache domain-containing protein [Rhodocyclaceae bacterium]
MRLRQKIIVLAILPMVAAVLAIAALVAYQARELARLEAELLEDSMLAAKRAELRHYVQMARTAIAHIYDETDRDDTLAREEVKRILSAMSFGEDGYFFAYDADGTNLVHPRQPDLVGTNLWKVRDPQGVAVIQRLLETAQQGGGFLRYVWNKPSTSQPADKLSYVVALDRWGWMYGTGIYLDDVAAVTGEIKERTAHNISATLLGLAAVAVVATLAVFAGGLALNISEQRIADQQLKLLTQRLVSSQEEERARVSRELHDGLSQLLVSTKFRFELAQERLQEGRGNAAEAIESGIAGLAGAINEIRRISHDLRPSLLDNLGLPAALEQLAEDFGHRTGIAVRAAIGPLPPLAAGSATTSLFRVAQEALTNVERHAHAAQVELTLDQDGSDLRLAIRDDGLGMAATGPLNKGIGLRNMRERVEHHGGALRVEQGNEVGGTLLIATVPLHMAEEKMA